jgi:phasin family protein
MLEKLRLPGIDTQKLIEGRRKDIEALLAANERAYVAVEALTRKQADLLSDVMKEWQASVKDVVAGTGIVEKLNQTADHAQRAFTHALTNMKEMAEIAARSNHEVLAILNKRYHDGVAEFRSSLRAKT